MDAVTNQLAVVQQELSRLNESQVAMLAALSAQQATLSAQASVLTELTTQQSSASLLAESTEAQQLQQRCSCSSGSGITSPLDKDELLDVVFSFVGIYTGAVSRRWRGRYIKLCYNNTAADTKDKLRTSRRSVLMTAARLQLALDSGLRIDDLQTDKKYSFAMIAVIYSIDPVSVLSLARVYGLEWSPFLTHFAATHNKLPLLQ
jgi:hypothetical protein